MPQTTLQNVDNSAVFASANITDFFWCADTKQVKNYNVISIFHGELPGCSRYAVPSFHPCRAVLELNLGSLKTNIMGLFSFIKNVGKKIFGSKEEAAAPAEKETLKASALLSYVKHLGLPYQNIKITLRGDDVILQGDVADQADSERITLAVGNVEGVDTVDNQMTVKSPGAESRYHTVVEGDWLSKIAEKYYGDAQKYNVIFEANKPMLKDPDEIYPGQVLRIPAV